MTATIVVSSVPMKDKTFDEVDGGGRGLILVIAVLHFQECESCERPNGLRRWKCLGISQAILQSTGAQ